MDDKTEEEVLRSLGFEEFPLSTVSQDAQAKFFRYDDGPFASENAAGAVTSTGQLWQRAESLTQREVQTLEAAGFRDGTLTSLEQAQLRVAAM